jgi:hypothetical protein
MDSEGTQSKGAKAQRDPEMISHRLRLSNSANWTVVVVLALAGLLVSEGASAGDDLERVVSDYTALYRADTLERWKELFLPSFTAASTREGGTVLERSLEEFYERRGATSRAAATSRRSWRTFPSSAREGSRACGRISS